MIDSVLGVTRTLVSVRLQLQVMHAIMSDDRVAITMYVKLDEDNIFVR